MRADPALQHRTIGILEDDPAVLGFIRDVVLRAPDLELAFAARTLAEARQAAAAGAPDLCLVDLRLPDGSGFDFLTDLKRDSDARVLVTTVLGDRDTVMKVLRAGADGYVLKSLGEEELLRHVRQTLAGFTPVSPQVASYLLELLRPEATGKATAGDLSLTTREAEILSIFGRGLSYDETARVLGVSTNTIRDFVKKIYVKLSVHSRAEAVFEAQALGLIDRHEPH